METSLESPINLAQPSEEASEKAADMEVDNNDSKLRKFSCIYGRIQR